MNRLIYTTEIEKYIFVLHAVQKTSKSGIAMAKKEIDMNKNRPKEAKALFKSLKEGTIGKKI